ncbi:MAG: M48 family metalloprotease [Deltaproteobacteria bacterium]|nr:M48 family metalloprotease [Deltaproteobacteria bacterium]
MTSRVPESQTSQILPPWLWFWMALYLLSLPDQMYVWRSIWQNFGDLCSNSENLIPLGFLLNASTTLEAVPLLVVFIGVLTIFFPRVRAVRLERQFRLTEPMMAQPAVREIRTFLGQHAPGIVVRANLLRTDQLAFVYPLGYRQTAIALFGGIILLWRSDQRAARALLLHEIAHYRQGDALIIGAGSFFTALLDRWFALYLGLVVLPLILVWGYGRLVHLHELSALRDIGVSLPVTDVLLHELSLFVHIFLPGTFFLSCGLLFWTVSIIILPLIGTWSAELNADRFAVALRQQPDDLLHALDKLARATSWWRWLFFRMSHPPTGLRRWMTLLSRRQIGLVVLLLLFPLAYVGRLAVLIAWATTGYLMTQSGSEIVLALGTNARTYLVGAVPVWLAMAVLLLLWPRVASYWEWLFCRHRGTFSWTGYRGYITTAILVVILGVSGYAADGRLAQWLADDSPVMTLQSRWTEGALVEVEWQGNWYPAKIIKIKDNSYYIHYEGFDSSWDEPVDTGRIRNRAKNAGHP